MKGGKSVSFISMDRIGVSPSDNVTVLLSRAKAAKHRNKKI